MIVGLLIVDCVIIAPNGIVGVIQGRRTSANVVADPAVFGLLYIINVIPLYFLQQEALAARPLEIIFWAILVFLAYMRGRFVGRTWLVALPLLAAALSVIPGPPWFWWLAVAFNAACLAGGLLLKPPRPAAVTPAAAEGRVP